MSDKSLQLTKHYPTPLGKGMVQMRGCHCCVPSSTPSADWHSVLCDVTVSKESCQPIPHMPFHSSSEETTPWVVTPLLSRAAADRVVHFPQIRQHLSGAVDIVSQFCLVMIYVLYYISSANQAHVGEPTGVVPENSSKKSLLGKSYTFLCNSHRDGSQK